MSLQAACTTAPKKDLALEQVRSQLEELESDPELSGYATLALERFVEHGDVDRPEFFDLQTPIRKYMGDNPDQIIGTSIGMRP